MRTGVLALTALVLLLVGCGTPVPADKADYVGTWRGPEMSLVITQNGNVQYERTKPNMKTSIDGPLRGFEGDNFQVGVPFVSTVFVVSRPPYRDGDQWKMVVDGVELTKVR